MINQAQMRFQNLDKETQSLLLTELGDDENSPNYEGSFTLEQGKGASTYNYLIGQGSQTWVVSCELWMQLQLMATKDYGDDGSIQE